MTQEQIDHGTKVLAEFMGWTYHDEPQPFYRRDGHDVFAWAMSWHNDWNRLHDVWDKLAPMLRDKGHIEMLHPIRYSIGESNMKATFEIMVKAVERINSQP